MWQKIPISSLLYLGWFVVGYATFSALWGNTESTIAQSTNPITFIQNVLLYLIMPHQHIGGLLFDLPFSLLPKPSIIIYAFFAITLIAIWLKRSPFGKHLILRYGILVGIVLAIAATIGNSATNQMCIESSTACLWLRLYTPISLGFYGIALTALLPLAVSANHPLRIARAHFSNRGIAGLVALTFFITSYFVAIYLPWKAREEYSRNYSSLLHDTLATLPSSFLIPLYIPHGISPEYTVTTSQPMIPTMQYACQNPPTTWSIAIQRRRLDSQAQTQTAYNTLIFYTGGFAYILTTNPACQTNPSMQEMQKMWQSTQSGAVD